jgi:hypothetical protein
MSDPDDTKTPLDSLLELGLYAPLGLALEARDRLPDLIARGRQQVASQVNLARMMGQYAVREGEKDWRKRLAEVQTTLQGLGLLPEPNPPAPAPGAPSPGTVPTPPPEMVAVNDTSASNGSVNGSGGSSANGSASAEPAVRARADLAIPGYDTLSASQVVQRLAGLSAEELEAVRDYESGTRGRRTILSKIASLQSDSSA